MNFKKMLIRDKYCYILIGKDLLSLTVDKSEENLSISVEYLRIQ